MTTPSSRGTKTVLTHNLATFTQRKNRMKSVHPSVSVSTLAQSWQFSTLIIFPVCTQHPPTWLSRALLFLCCFLVNYFLSDIVHSADQHLACFLPLQITQAILPSSAQCDWHQTVFSCIISSGHNFASLKTGAVVSPKLTTLGIGSAPPSTVLGDVAGACWSFHGHAGTFGVVLDRPNVMPSQIVIWHRLFNSTTSLSHAPRQITVWGLVDGEQNVKTYSQS
jgi:hypothetical protein